MSLNRTQKGWKHVGGDIPPEMYAKLIAEARKNGVGYAAVLRWALADYLAEPETEGVPG